MLKSMRSTKGRIAIASVMTAAFAALWLAYDLSLAIFPAIMVPIWVTVVVRQDEPVSPRSRQLLLLSIVAGVLVLLLAGGAFFFLR